MRRGLWAIALAAAVATAAHAQMPRSLPAEGKLGELRGGGEHPLPTVQIGDRRLRLAPGGRIFDEQNRTIVHGSLPRQATVLYVEDMNGDLARIYLLRPAEIEQIRRSR